VETGEPLVEIEAQAGDPPRATGPRRRRLSDVEAQEGEAPPTAPPTPQRRRRLETGEPDRADPAPPSQPASEPRRPRLVDVTNAPDGQGAPPRMGRSRGAITQACSDIPGLHNIIDLPGDVPPAGRIKKGSVATEGQARRSVSVAAVAGLTAAVVGAMVWALLAAATNRALGCMVIGVGLLVGGTVRTLGRGTDRSLGYVGAAATAFGCLLGHLLSICTTIAGQEGLSPLNVVTYITSSPAVIPGAMIATFHPLDLMFYGMAFYAGYRLSFRRPRRDAAA